MKIGVIAALDYEIELITEALVNKSSTVIGGKSFVSGTYGDNEIITVVCGIGKVHAAFTTQAMIDNFKPDMIINSGVSGCLSKELGICDIVVANKLCQHDVDLTPAGYNKGRIPGFDSEFFIPDADIAKRIYDLAVKNVSGSKVIMGTIATGDQLIASSEVKANIIENFSADTVEMESASIAQICQLNDVKYGIIRTISDNADEGANEDFDEFAKKAAVIGAKVILDFIK